MLARLFIPDTLAYSHSELFRSNIVQDVQGWYIGTPEVVRQDVFLQAPADGQIVAHLG